MLILMTREAWLRETYAKRRTQALAGKKTKWLWLATERVKTQRGAMVGLWFHYTGVKLLMWALLGVLLLQRL